MDSSKENDYSKHASLPIPTYDEATSRPSSSSSFLGATHISQDAERQRLLADGAHYHPPTVESARSSADLQDFEDEESSRASRENLHREIVQMQLDDPLHIEPRTSRISKQITSIRQSLSSIHVPLRSLRPFLGFVRDRSPRMSDWLKPNWILLGRLFALLLVLMVFYLIFFLNLGRSKDQSISAFLEAENIRQYVQDHINTTLIRQNLRYITSFDHIAGTKGNYILGKWVESKLLSSSIQDVNLERFDVFLNYPKSGGRRLAVVEPSELKWEVNIEEPDVYQETTREQTPVFHGLSQSATVRGPLIYASHGSRQDFRTLQEQGVNVTGAVVMVRHGGSRADLALKVKAAELAGAVGCITYSDPADNAPDASDTPAKGSSLPKTGIRRGTAALTNWVVGDVLSSGFSSLPGQTTRNPKEESLGLNHIPSIPISATNAENLMHKIKGSGEQVAKSWIGGLSTEYWTGSQASPVLELANEQDEEERQPIYNVLGSIPGVEQPEQVIIVGNHRDAWCFGAANPGGGTAVFVEVIRMLGELSAMGWRPLRTIKFASWDGSEYNLIGSTEHVENRLFDLRRDGVAYLNVDAAFSGRNFRAAASPAFEAVLLRVLERIAAPGQNQTLRHTWATQERQLDRLGVASDYVAFQDLAGMSSIDIGFSGDHFPDGSCYDNFDWMMNFGDPDFEYHGALAQIWTLLILEMADSPLIPFDFLAYSREVGTYIEDLEYYASKNVPQDHSLKFESLHYAKNTLVLGSKEFSEWNKLWKDYVYGEGLFESNVLAIKRRSHNLRAAKFESNLLDVDGGVSLSE